MDRIADITAALGKFILPGQLTEIRALKVQGKEAVRATWDGDHLDHAAREALKWEEQGASGVYFIPNPLLPSSYGHFATDVDVLARHWLLIDVDSIRPAKTGATDRERLAAWEVVQSVEATLAVVGYRRWVVGDSGNGYHVLVHFDPPLLNDAAAKNLCREVLHGLKSLCGNEKATVDTSTYNAARIVKLYGTLARKGTETAERPHRYSRLIPS